jgi:hypothetical protein
MIFTVLVPEYLVGKALSEKLAAKTGAKYWTRESDFDYKEIHGYMANMGYFVLDLGNLPPSQDDKITEKGEATSVNENETPELGDEIESGRTTNVSENKTSEPNKGIASVQSLFENFANEMQSTNLSYSKKINIARFNHRYWALNAMQWIRVKSLGIADMPQISVRQLERLDRGEALVKFLALVQVAYLIVQLIARKIENLPSSQLEIAALAYSASSMITYVLYWNRPQGIESIYVVKAKKMPQKDFLRYMLGPVYLWSTRMTEHTFDKEFDLAPIPNDSCHFTDQFGASLWDGIFANNTEIISLAFGALAGGMLFGGLHCLAWNFQFPTSGEALAWRVCSVITSSLPPLSIVPLAMWLQLNPYEGSESNDETNAKRVKVRRYIVGAAVIVVFLIPYVLARLFLIVEIFRSLFFLPPEVFIETWSGTFPHWG